MTTFQVLVDALVQALTRLIPLSPEVSRTVLQDQLGWNLPHEEMNLLILVAGSLCFLIFFRFDWLGLFSAFLTALTKPMTLKRERRSLDQHNLLFFLLALLPVLALRMVPDSETWAAEAFSHPGASAILSLVTAVFLHLSTRWNKRIHGLNHLRLSHGLFLGILLTASLLPSVPWMGLLWLGLAFCNYHYEAVFKYSMLAQGMNLLVLTCTQLTHITLSETWVRFGALNTLSVLAVGTTVFWIGLENLQKTFHEGTLRSFVWLNLGAAVLFLVHLILNHP